MAAGRRLTLVWQAGLVWADRGAPAYQRFIDTGSFGEDSTDATPYDANLVRSIVESGALL